MWNKWRWRLKGLENFRVSLNWNPQRVLCRRRLSGGGGREPKVIIVVILSLFFLIGFLIKLSSVGLFGNLPLPLINLCCESSRHLELSGFNEFLITRGQREIVKHFKNIHNCAASELLNETKTRVSLTMDHSGEKHSSIKFIYDFICHQRLQLNEFSVVALSVLRLAENLFISHEMRTRLVSIVSGDRLLLPRLKWNEENRDIKEWGQCQGRRFKGEDLIFKNFRRLWLNRQECASNF